MESDTLSSPFHGSTNMKIGVVLLLMELPGLEPDESLALCHRLENSLSMPGPMLVMDADEASSPEELKRHATEPVFVR